MIYNLVISKAKNNAHRTKLVYYAIIEKIPLDWDIIISKHSSVFKTNLDNSKSPKLPIDQIEDILLLEKIIQHFFERRDFKTINKLISCNKKILKINLELFKKIIPHLKTNSIPISFLTKEKIDLIITHNKKLSLHFSFGDWELINYYLQKNNDITSGLLWNVLQIRIDKSILKNEITNRNLAFELNATPNIPNYSLLLKIPNLSKKLSYLDKKYSTEKILNIINNTLETLRLLGENIPYLTAQIEALLILRELFFKASSFKNNINKSLYKDYHIKEASLTSELWRTFFKESESTMFKEKEHLINTLIKNKKVRKELYSYLFERKDNILNSTIIGSIIRLKEIYPDLDEQLLRPLFSNDFISPLTESGIYPTIAQFSNYNPRKTIKHLLIQTDTILDGHDLRDIVSMNKKLDLINNGIIYPKLKNLSELHNWLAQESAKLKQPKFNLNQKIEALDDVQLENFVIKIPKTNHDLISIGKSLKHCVGNGSYAKNTAFGEINILTLHKENKLYSCIEFKKNRIVQNKGLRNENIILNKEVEQKLVKLIMDELQKIS